MKKNPLWIKAFLFYWISLFDRLPITKQFNFHLKVFLKPVNYCFIKCCHFLLTPLHLWEKNEKKGRKKRWCTTLLCVWRRIRNQQEESAEVCNSKTLQIHTSAHIQPPHTPPYRCHWPTVAFYPNSPLIPLLLGNYHLGYALHMRLYPCQPYHFGFHGNMPLSNRAVRLWRDQWLVTVLSSECVDVFVCVSALLSLLVTHSEYLILPHMWKQEEHNGY